MNRERGVSAEEWARNGTAGTSDRIGRSGGPSVPRSAAHPHAKGDCARPCRTAIKPTTRRIGCSRPKMLRWM